MDSAATRRDGFEGKENPAWDSLDPARQADLARRMAVYAATVDHMDQQIGRVVADLQGARRTGPHAAAVSKRQRSVRGVGTLGDLISRSIRTGKLSRAGASTSARPTKKAWCTRARRSTRWAARAVISGTVQGGPTPATRPLSHVQALRSRRRHLHAADCPLARRHRQSR